MSGISAVRRRQALFRRIADAPGGATAALLDPQVLAEAQGKMDELKPLVVAEMQVAIDHIRGLADQAAGVDQIFLAAHDVRGLGGAYGFAGAGVVAGAIRAYGENRPRGFEPDWALIRLLAQMLSRTFERPEAASPQTLILLCREALAKVMAREGREMPEGVL